MSKKIDYNEILNRMGFFMNRANISARSLSFRFDHGEQYVKRILNKKVELKVKTLLEFFEIVDITPQDFFYLGDEYNKEDKNMLDLFRALSDEGKTTIVNLMKQMK